MGIRWHDRVFIAGQSDSGKSELCNYLFSRVLAQKVLWDTKGEFAIDGVPVTRKVDEIDWAAPVIHFQEVTGDLDQYDRLSHQINLRRNIVSCCHELADLCDDQPNRTPKWLRRHIRTGNVFGNGWISASQRPVGMPRQARTEARHVFQMVPQMDPDDHRVVARMFGLGSPNELTRLLQQAAGQSPHPGGAYAFVWLDRRAQQLSVCPPLPEQHRAQIIVRRTANI